MKKLLLLTCAKLTFQLAKQCACSEYKNQTDCQLLNCYWVNNLCRELTCADFGLDCDFVDCRWEGNGITVATSCKDNAYHCSWKSRDKRNCNYQNEKYNCVWNEFACVKFTKCSDYIIGVEGCSSKSSLISQCQDAADGRSCEDVPTPTCSTSNLMKHVTGFLICFAILMVVANN